MVSWVRAVVLTCMATLDAVFGSVRSPRRWMGPVLEQCPSTLLRSSAAWGRGVCDKHRRQQPPLAPAPGTWRQTALRLECVRRDRCAGGWPTSCPSLRGRQGRGPHPGRRLPRSVATSHQPSPPSTLKRAAKRHATGGSMRERELGELRGHTGSFYLHSIHVAILPSVRGVALADGTLT